MPVPPRIQCGPGHVSPVRDPSVPIWTASDRLDDCLSLCTSQPNAVGAQNGRDAPPTGGPAPPVAPPIPLLLPPPPVGSLSPAREMGACRRAVFVDRLWGVPFPPAFYWLGLSLCHTSLLGRLRSGRVARGNRIGLVSTQPASTASFLKFKCSLRGGEGRAPGRWGLGTQSWGACPGADTGAQRGGHGGRGWQPMRPQSPPVRGAHPPCRPHSELLPLVPTATLALWACPSAPLSSSVQPSRGARVARGPGPGGRGA